MNIHKAIEGFIIEIAASYAQTTVKMYSAVLTVFARHIHRENVQDITPDDLLQFFAFLKTDYQPKRYGGSTRPLSNAAIDNYWKCLRTFFKWCHNTLNIPRPDLNLPRPKFERPMIVPFSQDEVRRLLSAAGRSQKDRNLALLLTLLDTGIRVSELCRIRLQDVEQVSGEILITPFSTGRKTKTRYVYLGASARRAVWKYIARLNPPPHPKDRLFPLSPKQIRRILFDIGERANVPKTHPHRFRHTFAIQYLRNSGDIFTLQRLLGHSSLDMVRHYLALADTDSRNAHRTASPVDRWQL